MKRFKNILLVADRHADALSFKRTLALADAMRARLTVIDVLKPLPDSLRLAGIPIAEVQRLSVQDRLGELDRLIASEASADVSIDREVRVGIPFIEVIRKVLKNGHDLIVKSPEGKSGGTTPLFGSTDMHLLRKCPCPVWMLKPTRRKRLGHILAAVDLEMLDSTARALNDKIIDIATTLAKDEGGELHVVYAWSLFGESLLSGLRVEIEMHEALHQARTFYKFELEKLLRERDPENIRMHLLKGEPDKLIPKLAEQERIDLIVMGTVARTGIAGFLIGNTAEKVLNRVNCSVLALKPDGFQTPVRLEE